MVDYSESALVIVDDWITDVYGGAIDFAGNVYVGDLAPVQGQLRNPTDSVHTDVAQVLLDNASQEPRSLGTHTILPDINQLTTLEARTVYGKRFDDDVRELQDATAAFLADQYDDGEYVATPDDIVDLLNATAAFLADRSDGGYFCLDDATPGLLLPGQQSLLPASAAIDVTRTKYDATKDVVAVIDEYLHTQMSCKDEPNTPLLDAALKAVGVSTVDVPMVAHTSFDDIVDLPTPQLGEHDEPSWLDESFVTLDDHFDHSSDSNRQVDSSSNEDDDEDDDDNFSDATTDISDTAFDAPDALSLSQASYAASFFNVDTATLIVYTSMNELLLMDDGDKRLPCVPDALEGVDDDGDGDNGVAEIGDEVGGDDSEVVVVDLDDFRFDEGKPVEPSATNSREQRSMKIVTRLPTILEEDEPHSAVSSSSMDFTNHRGSLKKMPSRRENFLEDEGDVHDDKVLAPLSSNSVAAAVVMDVMATSAPHFETGASIKITSDDGLLQPISPCAIDSRSLDEAECHDEFFAGDIWNNEPNLELSTPVSRTNVGDVVDEAELKLFEALTAVFEVVHYLSWTDLPMFRAELKRKLRALMNDFRGLVSNGRVEVFIDLTIDHMAALGRSESAMA